MSEFQPDLFDAPDPPPAQRHSPTSVAAAEAVAPPRAGTLRALVLDWLRARGEEGGTDPEIQEALGLNPSTARPRRIELVKAGLARDSGRTRKTASGCKAVVWVATA